MDTSVECLIRNDKKKFDSRDNFGWSLGRDASVNCTVFTSFNNFSHIKQKFLSDSKEFNVANVRSATSFLWHTVVTGFRVS